MVEDADKSFLNDIIKEEDENGEQEETSQLKRDTQLEKEVAEAVDEILEEACIESRKQKPPQSKEKPIETSKTEIDSKSTEEIIQKESHKAPVDPPVVKQQPARPGPPSVPPPPPPPSIQSRISLEDEDENMFEANFDDAFGETPEAILPKQLGGRASIPDELEPHQLERLQNLKESNA